MVEQYPQPPKGIIEIKEMNKQFRFNTGKSQGLTAYFNAGTVFTQDDYMVNFKGGSITLKDNMTQYVYVLIDGINNNLYSGEVTQ